MCEHIHITLHLDKLLEDRQRWRACWQAGWRLFGANAGMVHAPWRFFSKVPLRFSFLFLKMRTPRWVQTPAGLHACSRCADLRDFGLQGDLLPGLAVLFNRIPVVAHGYVCPAQTGAGILASACDETKGEIRKATQSS